MPRIHDTTNRQSAFLRALSRNPTGLPKDQWPSPTVLRRWLRKPGFRAALETLRATLAAQTDLQLAYAASRTAAALNEPAPSAADDPKQSSLALRRSRLALDLLKFAHLRATFAPPAPPPAVKTAEHALKIIETAPPYMIVKEYLPHLRKKLAPMPRATASFDNGRQPISNTNSNATPVPPAPRTP